MIFVIDDDAVMAGCMARACGGNAKIFTNAVLAMEDIARGVLPDLIFLDILLDGPDGFTFLNELVSYDDTAKIPIVVVSSLDYEKVDLSEYGVVGFLSKEKMRPKEIKDYVERYAK